MPLTVLSADPSHSPPTRTDMSLDAHLNNVTRIFPRLGQTATARQILALLDARLG
jgi:hypothetical protein